MPIYRAKKFGTGLALIDRKEFDGLIEKSCDAEVQIGFGHIQAGVRYSRMVVKSLFLAKWIACPLANRTKIQLLHCKN
jgi:hypothetical protein